LVGWRFEKEGKGKGVIRLTISCTDQINTDRDTERENWRDVSQPLTIAVET